MSGYNPYVPPTAPQSPAATKLPATRASWIVVALGVVTLALCALWALMTLGVAVYLAKPNHVWSRSEQSVGLYAAVAAPWSPAATVGLFRRRPWGWAVAVGYYAITLLTVVGAPLAILALIGLAHPSVRRQFATGEPRLPPSP